MSGAGAASGRRAADRGVGGHEQSAVEPARGDVEPQSTGCALDPGGDLEELQTQDGHGGGGERGVAELLAEQVHERIGDRMELTRRALAR